MQKPLAVDRPSPAFSVRRSPIPPLSMFLTIFAKPMHSTNSIVSIDYHDIGGVSRPQIALAWYGCTTTNRPGPGEGAAHSLRSGQAFTTFPPLLCWNIKASPLALRTHEKSPQQQQRPFRPQFRPATRLRESPVHGECRGAPTAYYGRIPRAQGSVRPREDREHGGLLRFRADLAARRGHREPAQAGSCSA